MTTEQKEIVQTKERRIRTAAKVLVLVPFITFIIFLLLIPVTPRDGQVILFAFMVFLITIGLILSIVGTVMSIKQRMTLYIVLGIITIIHILIMAFLLFFIWNIFKDMNGMPL